MSHDAVPPELVDRAHYALEPLHACVYFSSEAEAEYAAAGVKRGRGQYFASRSAAMGAVGAGVVTATFYNFNPGLVAHFVPAVWADVTPETMIAARWQAAHRTLQRALGEIDDADIVDLVTLLNCALKAATPDGRPLYAAHAELDPPTDPLVALWHAVTLLREHRGDGHIAVLVDRGVSGLDALITHVATGHGFTAAAAQRLRGWPDEQWQAAVAGLQQRGLLDRDGALTDAGVALRTDIEDATTRNASAPWRRLGRDGTERVVELGRTMGRLARGTMPAEIFAATASG